MGNSCFTGAVSPSLPTVQSSAIACTPSTSAAPIRDRRLLLLSETALVRNVAQPQRPPVHPLEPDSSAPCDGNEFSVRQSSTTHRGGLDGSSYSAAGSRFFGTTYRTDSLVAQRPAGSTFSVASLLPSASMSEYSFGTQDLLSTPRAESW